LILTPSTPSRSFTFQSSGRCVSIFCDAGELTDCTRDSLVVRTLSGLNSYPVDAEKAQFLISCSTR